MLIRDEDIYPGRVVMLDANLFDVSNCSTGSPSTRSHYCVCLEVTAERVCWLPINSGKSAGRLPIFREEKSGHPNWVNNPKKKFSQGVSYYYPTQVWALSHHTSRSASRHDLSTCQSPNIVRPGCLARILSDCGQALEQARTLPPG
ncbi:MAG: hypothetical protein HY916_04715 [Desulfovibrio sp.]|jgi:hypothetical protein|nr:hypothetical protein [Desulfovibrio sp.]